MEVIYANVETNIKKGTTLDKRLTHVNKIMKKNQQIIIEENILEYRKYIFLKKIEKQYTLIHCNNLENVIIANNVTEKEAELYLLGMMNGFEAIRLDFTK